MLAIESLTFINPEKWAKYKINLNNQIGSVVNVTYPPIEL